MDTTSAFNNAAVAVDHSRAEMLLRTITGIADARIVPHPSGGVSMVRVHCNDEASPGQIVRNVRSALMAGCGIAVSAECIDFVAADELLDDDVIPGALVLHPKEPSPQDTTGDSDVAPRSAPAHSPAATPIHAQPGAGTIPVRGIQVARPYRDSTAPAAMLDMQEVPVRGITQAPPSRILHVVAEEEVAAKPAAAPLDLNARARDMGERTTASLKLESVELRRQSGRIRCRVVISLGNEHFSAVADSWDGSAGEAQLAGRVACDALRAGGFTEARFDGAAIAQINGRQHVVVALHEWMGGETMVLSGAAPLEDSPERAAAVAAIKAVLAQDIN